MNTDNIRCLCGKVFDEKNFTIHCKICKLFLKEFTNFDLIIAKALEKYSYNKENLFIIKFMLKRYLKLIERKIKKYKGHNNIWQMNNFINNNIIFNNMNNNKNNPIYNNFNYKYNINNNIYNFPYSKNNVLNLYQSSSFNAKNNIYNLANPKNDFDIIATYKSPTLIGLNKIDKSSFMNSALICLSQTKRLTNYFLYKQNKGGIYNNTCVLANNSTTQLSPAYLELISKLWNKNGPKSFSPIDFINTLKKINPTLKYSQAQDSSCFIISILEQLHKELKKPICQNNNQNQPINQYDYRSARNYFINDFKKEGSIISDLFFGFTETTNECLYCKQNFSKKGMPGPICYNYGVFNSLIFPLEQVKNMKNNYSKMNSNNLVTIYDCFIYNQKTEFFTGKNRNFCNICKQNSDANFTSKIFVSPDILMLVFDSAFDAKLIFNEQIDITQYVLRKDKPKLLYDLYAVIFNNGKRDPDSHFVASCKSPVNKKWYIYNDAFVNPVKNFLMEAINYETPYILFYEKV